MRQPKRSYLTTPLQTSTDEELTPLRRATGPTLGYKGIKLPTGQYKCLSIRNVYPGGSWSSGKQYLQFIHERHDETGTGPGSPGPLWGRHRPMADVYDTARAARGAGDNLCSRKQRLSKAIIENNILCNDVANCDSIWRFDNMTPASRCRLMAAASACSLPS